MWLARKGHVELVSSSEDVTEHLWFVRPKGCGATNEQILVTVNSLYTHFLFMWTMDCDGYKSGQPNISFMCKAVGAGPCGSAYANPM